MAKKFLVNIDLVKNQILNHVLHISAGDPSTPVEGQVWYDSVDERLSYRASGSTLVPLVSVDDIPDGSIANTKLTTNPLARANHTGTQLAATISDLSAAISGTSVGGDLTGTIANAQIAAGAITNADINASAAIALSKLATDPLARANHTGTQTASTISNFAATVSANAIAGDITGTVGATQIAAGVIVNADINASAGIALSKLATDPLARANHTGTQAHTTISDFDAGVQTNRLDQMAAPTADVSLGSQKITNLASPTAGTDAANKNYVDQAVAGLSWKEAVRVATTANITLSGTQTIDGVAVVAGDRVLVKNQSTASQNGIYVVSAGGWSRATDADSQDDLLGAAMFVQEGSTSGNTQWILSTDAPISVGSTSLTFDQFGGGVTYSAGDGLSLSGSTFNVGAGTGITVAADTVSIDTSLVPRKFSANIGNGSLTSITATHNFATRDVVVEVYDNASFDTVECDVVRTSTNVVTLTFAVAPASNAYRVVIIG